MANPEHLAKLREGVEAWNAWRGKNPETKPDLSTADLHGLDLSTADLVNADLSEAVLDDSGLTEARLVQADLFLARLERASLFLADLTDADLTDANLSGADLGKANFAGSRLLGADLSEADLFETVLVDLDLSTTKGLEDCKHLGPSFVDHLTLSKSNPLPPAFLRGCGFSDWQIEESELLTPDLGPDEISKIQNRVLELRSAHPIQIHPLFISYSHANAGFVDTLESKLHDAGVLFWRDIHDMTAGRLDRQIEHAIDENRTLLIVLSEASVESDWVEYEIDRSTKLSKKVGRDTLCPIALDDAWKTCDWPGPLRKQIQNFNILDFSEWQDAEKLGQKFRKLIRGLELFYKPKDGRTAADEG